MKLLVILSALLCALGVVHGFGVAPATKVAKVGPLVPAAPEKETSTQLNYGLAYDYDYGRRGYGGYGGGYGYYDGPMSRYGGCTLSAAAA